MSSVKMPVVLVALAPLALALPVAMDIYVPALPRITELFHTSPAVMQLTLNLFMFLSGLVQFCIGPVVDRFGRRAVVAVAIFLFALGSLLCSQAVDIRGLIWGRLIQAIGSCIMLVLSFTIGRDLFSGVRLAKCYSFLNGIISFSPMLAPFIGSYLDIEYGWQSTFYSLLVIALGASVLYFSLLKESWPVSNRTAFNWQVIDEYKKIGRHPIFIFYTLASAMGLSYLFLFCTISPVLLMSILHVPEAEYGYYFFFMGISFFFGSIFSAYVVGKLGIYRTVLLGFVITLVGAILLCGWHLIVGVSIAGFVVPMLLIGVGGTCSMGAGSAGAVELFQQQSGVASAFSAGCRFLFSAVIGLFISRYIHSALPLGIPALIFSFIGILLFLIYRKQLEFTLSE